LIENLVSAMIDLAINDIKTEAGNIPIVVDEKNLTDIGDENLSSNISSKNKSLKVNTNDKNNKNSNETTKNNGNVSSIKSKTKSKLYKNSIADVISNKENVCNECVEKEIINLNLKAQLIAMTTKNPESQASQLIENFHKEQAKMNERLNNLSQELSNQKKTMRDESAKQQQKFNYQAKELTKFKNMGNELNNQKKKLEHQASKLEIFTMQIKDLNLKILIKDDEIDILRDSVETLNAGIFINSFLILYAQIVSNLCTKFWAYIVQEDLLKEKFETKKTTKSYFFENVENNKCKSHENFHNVLVETCFFFEIPYIEVYGILIDTKRKRNAKFHSSLESSILFDKIKFEVQNAEKNGWLNNEWTKYYNKAFEILEANKEKIC
jgi:hypothetical protein